MARDTRKQFLAELAKVAPRIGRAFEEAVQDIRSASQARLIDEAIKRAIDTGNIARGVQEIAAAINLGPDFFAPLDRQIAEAFYAGGLWQASTLPKQPLGGSAGRLVVRFQGSNPRAQEWTRTHAGDLITEIAEDTRTVIREAIDAGIRQDRGYRKITLDLIGRVEGNQRKGGLIGLHSRQAAAVSNARDDLLNLDVRYFTRQARDKRFDRTVRKAIRDGKPLSQADIDRITGRYADRLLQVRGKTIARTEGNKAMQAGRTESVQQMIDAGKVPQSAVSKIWDAVISVRTRDSHLALNGTEVRWNEKFISPVTGAELDHPHDETAPGEETINCRCTMRTRIDYTQMAI